VKRAQAKPEIGTVWKRSVVGARDYTVEYVIPPEYSFEVKTLIMELKGELDKFDELLGRECTYTVDLFYEIFIPYDAEFVEPRRLLPLGEITSVSGTR
jgi:hypothetical protein